MHIDGESCPIQPKESVWYQMYIKNPKLRNKKFKRKWRDIDLTGKPASPIELLVLGLLCSLGRGLVFNGLEKYTAITEEVH
eukprot:8275871-Ditylum_brightwellii.AAC.1